MKKPSLIIGKKQIILSCLTLMLAIAVYVNYAMSDGKLETAQVQSKDSVTYGDTAFVNAEAEQSEPAAEDSTPAEESAADGHIPPTGKPLLKKLPQRSKPTTPPPAVRRIISHRQDWNGLPAVTKAWRRCSPCWGQEIGQRTNW